MQYVLVSFVLCQVLVCLSSPVSDSRLNEVDQIIWVEEGSKLPTLSCHTINAHNMYTWQIKDLLEYNSRNDPKYKFQNNELTLLNPVTLDDAGIYKCSTISGHGSQSIVYNVKVRQQNAKLNCWKSICFSDPEKFSRKLEKLEVHPGSFVELDCSAFSTNNAQIYYQWYFNQHRIDEPGEPSKFLRNINSKDVGLYTCHASSSSNENLSLTFRVTLTQQPNDEPMILTKFSDLNLVQDNSTVIQADVKCLCDNPIVKWLKRVEARDFNLHAEKISLPNPRPDEKNEYFYVLENHPNSLIEIDSPELVNWAKGNEKIYRTKLKFRGPYVEKIHSGKYVLMTTNENSVNYRIIYETFNVAIANSNKFEEKANVIYYFLVPFIVFFVALVIIVYCIFLRRNRKSLMSMDDSGHWITSRMLNSPMSDHDRYRKTSSHFNPMQTNNLRPYSLLNPNQTPKSQANSDESPNNNNHPNSIAYYNSSNSSNEYRYPIPSSNLTQYNSMQQYNDKTLTTELPYEQQYAAVGNMNTLSSQNTNPYAVPCYDEADLDNNNKINNPFLHQHPYMN